MKFFLKKSYNIDEIKKIKLKKKGQKVRNQQQRHKQKSQRKRSCSSEVGGTVLAGRGFLAAVGRLKEAEACLGTRFNLCSQKISNFFLLKFNMVCTF
jgi:hypothetical protein